MNITIASGKGGTGKTTIVTKTGTQQNLIKNL